MNKRIFIGTGDTSGFYSRLCEGFKRLGVQVCFAEIETNKHDYKINAEENKVISLCRYYFDKVQKSGKILKLYYYIMYQFFKVFLFLIAIYRYDIFIFTQCKCFWSLYELKLLKALKKTTVMFCLGSATRLPYTDGTDVYGIYTSKIPSVRRLKRITKKRKRKIKIIEKYVSYFINLPSQAQLCSKPFLSLCEIGIPFYFSKDFSCLLQKPQKVGQEICILHVASYLGCRGTSEFREIIRELQKIYPINYIELSGVPNLVVLEKIQECDFVLDELYSDTPMATFVTEAAWFGKPAIVSGYFSKQYKNFYSEDMLPPSLYVHPDEVKDAIIKMIEKKEYRIELGNNARKFVEDKMSCEKVAERVYSIFEGKARSSWYVNPYKLNYIYGYGMKKDEVAKKLREIYDQYGEKGWGISDHAELQKAAYQLMNTLNRKGTDEKND